MRAAPAAAGARTNRHVLFDSFVEHTKRVSPTCLVHLDDDDQSTGAGGGFRSRLGLRPESIKAKSAPVFDP